MFRVSKILLWVLIAGILFNIGCKRKEGDDVQDAPVKTEEAVKSEVDIAAVEKPVAGEDKPKAGKHDGWMDDFEAAKKKAAAEDKDMLVDFTGSDWCGWCIKLDKEAFGKKEFIEKASKDFVLVMLDFPRDTSKVTPEIKAQNARLQRQFGQTGFPTVYLTDSSGRPYAQTGYIEGGVKAYLEHLAPFAEQGDKIGEFFTKAGNAELAAHERAIFIDRAIALVSPQLVARFYSDQVEKIISLDSENQAQLKNKYLVTTAMWQAEEQLNLGNVKAALEKIDKTIKDYQVAGPAAQEVYYFKAIILDQTGDKAGAVDSLNKAIDAVADSKMADHIRDIIKNYFSDVKAK